jgi:hypothetical protein
VVVAIGLAGAARASDTPTVDTNGRDAVVVVDLINAAPPDHKQFYEIAETFALSESRSKLPPLYHEVAVLSDEQATVTELEQTLARMAARDATRAIDLYVHLHGAPGTVWFHEGAVSVADLAGQFDKAGRYGGKLRAVYSAACYGTTHAADWLTAGFRVAGGAEGVNANTAYDLPVFIQSWGAGATFGDTETKANNPGWLKYYDGVATKMGFSDVNSFKDVDGDAVLTIASLPQP